MTRTLVISAVNFTEGGPLTVLRDALDSAADALPNEWRIYALVHKRSLIANERIVLLEVPGSKKSWLRRLYFEWWHFSKLSRELKPDLWLSLHDITPRVSARRQAVYCHNPAPFYRTCWRDARMEPKFFAFNLLYSHLYRAFMNRNDWIIVQQNWLRGEFVKLFNPRNVVVAYPVNERRPDEGENSYIRSPQIFLYPALPRVFKNLEVLCEAARLLRQRGERNFEVRLTLDGRENAYARWIFNSYWAEPNIKFIGRQSTAEMHMQYSSCGTVVFPSKLETWGLPISEARRYGCNVLLANLPYAREAIGSYSRASFFNPTSAQELADLMHSVISGTWTPHGATGETPEQPFAPDWQTLWKLLTKGL